MKRYRIINFDYDTRANILIQEVGAHWDEASKTLWQQNKASVRHRLRKNFGETDANQKERNLIALGPKVLSILAFHNVFFEQVRISFIMGSYYPALTGICALGERVLNHLILKFRNDFKGTKEYKRVYRKDSFDDWIEAIDTLEAWKILLPSSADEFRSLRKIRNQSIHFRPEVDTNDRELALIAIKYFQNILKHQFSILDPLPWILITPGESYIKKEWESNPFVREIYLPNCCKVSPYHRVESVFPFVIRDNDNLEFKDISDEEFAKIRAEFLKR